MEANFTIFPYTPAIRSLSIVLYSTGYPTTTQAEAAMIPTRHTNRFIVSYS